MNTCMNSKKRETTVHCSDIPSSLLRRCTFYAHTSRSLVDLCVPSHSFTCYDSFSVHLAVLCGCLRMYITSFDCTVTGLGKRRRYMIRYLVRFQVKVHRCFILHRRSPLRSPTCSGGLCTSGLSPIACYTRRVPRLGLIAGHPAREHWSEMESISTRTR